MMEPAHGPSTAVRTEHALAFATYARRFTQGVAAASLLHPEPPSPEWFQFFEELHARLDGIAASLSGDEAAVIAPQPATTEMTESQIALPPGEDQGQSVRLRRQVEVLQKSAWGLQSSAPPVLVQAASKR